MKARDLGRIRLSSLHIASSRCSDSLEVVHSLGALQAQDYAGALWAIGLRVPGAVLTDVEAAVAARRIVRTWPLRGTLHFVAATDIYWLLDLLSARVIKASARRAEQLELDAGTFRKVERLLVHALAGGAQLTRDAVRTLVAEAGISPDGGRLYHCLWRLALEQVICFGVPEGKQPTFTLLSEWVPSKKQLGRDEALATLTARYFASHGPATVQDFMRWARLTAAEVKLGLAAAAQALRPLEIEGRPYYQSADSEDRGRPGRGTFLLPGFDEFMLGYGDRSAVLDLEHAPKIVPGENGVFRPTVVHDGKVVGTWRASPSKQSVRLTSNAFSVLSKAQQQGLARAARRYGEFLGKSVVL